MLKRIVVVVLMAGLFAGCLAEVHLTPKQAKLLKKMELPK